MRSSGRGAAPTARDDRRDPGHRRRLPAGRRHGHHAGVVTAAYPTGGFNGYVIQTAGHRRRAPTRRHGASDAVFVFSAATAAAVAIGDHVRGHRRRVRVQRPHASSTSPPRPLELIAAAASRSTPPCTAPWPATDAGREALESMLFQPAGRLHGHEHVRHQPVRRGRSGRRQHAAAAAHRRRPPRLAPSTRAVAADNAARGVTARRRRHRTNFLTRPPTPVAAAAVPDR